jgi:transcriptional regulator with XRE-family HTH domain
VNLGLKIKELRQKKNLNQQVLADKLGVGVPSISAYESGRQIPPTDKLALLAEILETTTDDLLDYKPFPPVEDFGVKKRCELCEEKDYIISLLREQIEELKDHIKTLLSHL